MSSSLKVSCRVCSLGMVPASHLGQASGVFVSGLLANASGLDSVEVVLVQDDVVSQARGDHLDFDELLDEVGVFIELDGAVHLVGTLDAERAEDDALTGWGAEVDGDGLGLRINELHKLVPSYKEVSDGECGPVAPVYEGDRGWSTYRGSIPR